SSLLQPHDNTSKKQPVLRKQTRSRCSHGRMGRLSRTTTSTDSSRPQVRTPDGFVLWRTGGYYVELAEVQTCSCSSTTTIHLLTTSRSISASLDVSLSLGGMTRFPYRKLTH